MDNVKGQMKPDILNSVSIRTAVASDVGDITNLFMETVLERCSGEYSREQLTAWSSAGLDHKRWLNKIKTQYFLVAVLDSTIVGFGSLEKPDCLDLLYIHKNYQRCGIAAKLFDLLEMEFRKSRLMTINADVSATARPFFERKGFRTICENHFTVGETAMMNFKMQKEVDQ
jgi:putative acetyltransferase